MDGEEKEVMIRGPYGAELPNFDSTSQHHPTADNLTEPTTDGDYLTD